MHQDGRARADRCGVWRRTARSGPGQLDLVSGVDRGGAIGCGHDEDRDTLAQAVGTALRVGGHARARAFPAAQWHELDLFRHPDERAPWTLHRDESFGAKLRDGLPDCRAADAVLLRQPELAGQRLARTELAGLDLVAQQVRELAEDGAVGRGIDHAGHRTWPRCSVTLYVQAHVVMLPPPR